MAVDGLGEVLTLYYGLSNGVTHTPLLTSPDLILE
jgi:hypothetical protein